MTPQVFGTQDQSERSSAVLRLGNLKHQENASTDKLIARKALPLGGPATFSAVACKQPKAPTKKSMPNITKKEVLYFRART